MMRRTSMKDSELLAPTGSRVLSNAESTSDASIHRAVRIKILNKTNVASIVPVQRAAHVPTFRHVRVPAEWMATTPAVRAVRRPVVDCLRELGEPAIDFLPCG